MPTGKQRVRNYPKTSILAKSLDAVKSRYEPVNTVGQVKLSQLEEAAAREGPRNFQDRENNIFIKLYDLYKKRGR